MKQILHQLECHVHHSLGADRPRGLLRGIPIQPLTSHDHRRHVRDPHQSLPKMLGAVNADQDEFILFRQRRNPVAIQPNSRSPREIIFHRQGPRKITESPLSVQLHEQPGSGLQEQIFAGNLSGFHRLNRHIRFIAAIDQNAGRRKQVPRPNEEIEIDVLPEARIAVCSNGKHRALDDHCFHARRR